MTKKAKQTAKVARTVKTKVIKKEKAVKWAKPYEKKIRMFKN